MIRPGFRLKSTRNLTGWRALQACLLVLAIMLYQVFAPHIASATPLKDKTVEQKGGSQPGEQTPPTDGNSAYQTDSDAATPDGSFSGLAGIVRGNAVGVDIYVAASGTSRTGPLYPVSVACNVEPVNKSAASASASLGSLGNTGAIEDRVITTHSTQQQTVQATSTVQGLDILGGMIQATTIQASAKTAANNTTINNSGSTKLSGVVIAGQTLTANPAPNSMVTIANFGSVYLNKQTLTSSGNSRSLLQVTALEIRITARDIPNLPVGTRLIFGQVSSGFDRLAATFLTSGSAYALNASGLAVGPASSGPYAAASIGCMGGVASAQVNGNSLPNVFNVGVMSTTVRGQIISGGASVNSHTQTGSVNLLAGLISADAISTNATIGFNGRDNTATASTEFTNLKIAWQSYPANVPANTRVNLPGVGYVVLNGSSTNTKGTRPSATANAMIVYVTVSGGSLPVGARIVVGHAQAGG